MEFLASIVKKIVDDINNNQRHVININNTNKVLTNTSNEQDFIDVIKHTLTINRERVCCKKYLAGQENWGVVSNINATPQSPIRYELYQS